MDLSTQRRCLTTLAGGLLVGAVGAVAWSLSSIDTSAESPTNRSSPVASDSALASSQSGIDFDDSLANAPLRGPLYDPPVVVRPPTPPPTPTKRVERRKPPPPAPKLQMTLIGTFIQSSGSYVVVSDSSGKYDRKSVGETLDLNPPGVTVEKIASGEVTLQYNGNSSTIKVDRSTGAGKAGKAGGGAGRRNNNSRKRIP